MVNYTDEITERYINQGDLIFLLHKEKPTKNGWWRKVNDGKNEVIYVLEKPMHKDFSLNRKEIKNSRIECNTCVMRDTTLKFGQNQGKFEVLISAGGLAQYFIMKNNYLIDLNDDMFEELLTYTIDITDRGEELLKLYSKKNNKSDLNSIVMNLV